MLRRRLSRGIATTLIQIDCVSGHRNTHVYTGLATDIEIASVFCSYLDVNMQCSICYFNAFAAFCCLRFVPRLVFAAICSVFEGLVEN